MLHSILVAMIAVAPEGATPSWWDAPATCPDAATMQRRIDALVPAGEAAARGRVHIVDGPAGATATITITRAAGDETRVIAGESCNAIADAVALVLAIGSTPIDGAPPQPEPIVPDIDRPAPGPTPAPDRPTSRGRAPAPTARATTVAPPLRLAMWIDAGITVRLVPAVGPTIAAGVAVVGPRWRVEFAAIGTTPRQRRLPAPNDGVRAEVSSGVASIRGAYVPRWGSIELPIRGGIDVGAASAISRGTPDATRRPALLAALEAGVGLAWAPLPALALKLEVSGLFAFARPRFAVHTPTADALAFATPWLGLRALAGIEGRIPTRGRLR